MLTAPAQPSSADLAAGAEKALPIVREDAQVVEAKRALTPKVARAVTEAGFPRHFVPARWGGTAGTFASLLTAGAHLAEASASAAWCAVLYAAHGRLAAFLPEEGQKDLWRDGPDRRIAASVVPPQGAARPDAGGWRLSGKWAYASGVDHADWVLLACWTDGDDGQRQHRVFAVPREELTVIDTWRTLGLRGTGSNTVSAGDVFVPAHRTFTLRDLMRPQGGGARCHRVPYPMVAALLFAAPALGVSRAALREWIATIAGKKRADGRVMGDTSKAQLALARSSADIEAARHLLEAAAQRADQAPVTALSVAENQRDVTAAVTLCVQGVERLFKTSGAGGLAEGHPLQQCWRDVTAVASHAALDADTAAGAYAQAALAAAEEARR
jgi:two-component flavin-dependent monooxygenase